MLREAVAVTLSSANRRRRRKTSDFTQKTKIRARARLRTAASIGSRLREAAEDRVLGLICVTKSLPRADEASC